MSHPPQPEPTAYEPPSPEPPVSRPSAPPPQEQPSFNQPMPPPQQEQPQFEQPAPPPSQEPQAFEPPAPSPPPEEQQPAAFEPQTQHKPEPQPFEPEEQQAPSQPEKFAAPPKRIDRWAEEEEEEPGKGAKRSIVPVIIIILAIAALGAAGYFFGPKLLKMVRPPQPESETPAVAEAPEVPQLPVEAPLEDSATEATVPEEKETIEEKAPAPPKKTVRRPARRQRQASRTPARKPAPKPSPAKTATPKVNRLTITSVPSGAEISIDEKTKGTTPYRWEKPDVYGTIKVTAEKEGYVSKTDFVQYEGGIKQHTIRLEKKPAPVAAKPSAPARKPAPAPEQKPSKPSPSPSASSSAPSKPEPEPSKPAAGAAGGEPATIFISSLPPIADVYMDGKYLGKTNRDKLKVLSGTHTMKFTKGGKEIIKKMTFQPGSNPSRLIRIP
ncbi:MAG: PEGA domain-containing protein [Chitinivibrionales bacterium]|nr:PEGA domain-containing protein [Chitinivibrionales bacterium]